MFNFESTLRAGGILALIAIGLVVFGETGLFIGVILPGGDTTLLLAGSFAATGVIPLVPLILVVITATILGDNFAYEIGKRSGKRIFKRKESVLFDPENLVRAEKFYEKHGGKTVLFARFVPVVRTFAPLVAGVGRMDRKRFLLYNTIGAMLWGAGLTMAGYLLGSILGERITDLEKYIVGAFAISLIAGLSPALYQLFRVKVLHRRIRPSKETAEELKKASEEVEEAVKD